jgi:P-type Cu+ transporter
MAMSSVSVVTNALRLRSFERPAGAKEILHPPLLARLSEVAYLGAVALVALGIGTAAIFLAPAQQDDVVPGGGAVQDGSKAGGHGGE